MSRSLAPCGWSTPVSRGQVGIGTLVVFIAMVLVAAIAAGVLINTAGFLQTKSKVTGDEASKQVSNRIQVVSARGEVTEASPTDERGILLHGSGKVGSAEELFISSSEKFRVIQSGGSDTLIVDGTSTVTMTEQYKLTISLVGHNTVEITNTTNGNVIATAEANATLFASNDGFVLDHQGSDTTPHIDDAYAAYANVLPGSNIVTNVTLTAQRSPGAGDVDLQNATIHYVSDDTSHMLTYTDGEANATTFSVTSITASDPLLTEGERVAIIVDALAIDGGLRMGESARLRLVTPSGAVTVVRLTPPSMSGESAVTL